VASWEREFDVGFRLSLPLLFLRDLLSALDFFPWRKNGSVNLQNSETSTTSRKSGSKDLLSKLGRKFREDGELGEWLLEEKSAEALFENVHGCGNLRDVHRRSPRGDEAARCYEGSCLFSLRWVLKSRKVGALHMA